MANFNKKHGMTGTKVFDVWVNIKQRTCNPKMRAWKRYGGRGITVCEAWKNDFQAFYDYVGDIPFDRAQIDRINNDGNYEPGNVRWVTAKQNARNKGDNRIMEYKGKTATMAEHCDDLGLSEHLVLSRMFHGHTFEEAIKIPHRARSKKKLYEYKGQMLTPSKISELSGFEHSLVGRRLKLGWTMEEATTIPPRLGQKLHSREGNMRRQCDQVVTK
jgi:hypothetical protein